MKKNVGQGLKMMERMRQTPRAVYGQYMIAAAVPLTLLSLIRISYLLSQPGDMLKIYGWVNILFCCLASVSFFAYTRHTTMMPAKGETLRQICAVAYGMCAYVVSQESATWHLLAYAVFPLLFLCLEQMVREGKYLRFVIAGGVFLLTDPQTCIPVMLLLFVYAVLESARIRRLRLEEFLHLAGCFLFSFGIAAVRILFYYAPMLQDQKTYGYPGFQLNLSLPVLLAKLFPGAASSRGMLSAVGGLDLYFGMLLLLAAFLFFCNASISGRKRVYYFVYALILLLAVECTPLYYLCHLFRVPIGSTISFSFLFSFWLLRLSWEGFARLGEMASGRRLQAVLILLGMGAFVWLFGAHNFGRAALPFQLICLVLYAALLLGYGKKFRGSKSFRTCLLILAAAEISGGICLTYWKPLRAQQPSSFARFIGDVQAAETGETEKSAGSGSQAGGESQEEIYRDFVEKHTDEEMEMLVSQLLNMETLEEKEEEKYCGTFLPDAMEYINGVCHKIGIEQELFQELETELTFDEEENYTVLSSGDHIYNLSTLKDGEKKGKYLLTYHFQPEKEDAADLYFCTDRSRQIIRLDEPEDGKEVSGYLLMQVRAPVAINFRAAVYRMDREVAAQVEKTVNGRLAKEDQNEESSSSLILIDAVGVAISYLFLMLLFLLCGYNHKEKLYRAMYRAKSRIGENSLTGKAGEWIRGNRIYLLAFLIPFTCYILCMIVADCAPFGSGSFYFSDGLAGTFPVIADNYYKYQVGNEYLTMNAGYGFDLSLYYTYVLMAKLYHLLPLETAANLFFFGIGMMVGLSGWSMMYYMTHRIESPAARKQDFCLLIPACIYAMSAHMIAFLCWPTWYAALALFPLLMLAYERMVYGRGSFSYVFLLGICILVEIQLAMYMCIFLVIRFFLVRFCDIRDFLQKGIRFGVTSLLAGGCGFLVVYRTMLGYSAGGYQAEDAKFPIPGLHGSFWEQWKKFFCLTPTVAVSHDNGDLSGYCGILTLLLAVIWFAWSGRKLSEKIRRLTPLVILAASFNGRVLSYLWNGFHYQSNVPNRYVFLLTFLLGALAYDALDTLRNLSRRKMACVTCFAVLAEGLIYQYGEGVTTAAACATLFLITVYAALHQISSDRRKTAVVYRRLIVGMLLAELAVNMVFLALQIPSETLENVAGDYESHAVMVDEHLREEGSFSRGCYVKEYLYNEGELYNMGANSLFNSFVSMNQLRMQADYGFYWANNNMYARSLSNPFGLSLAGDRYLFLSEAMLQPVYDVGRYRYVGHENGYYIYENPDALSLGVYAPKGLAELSSEVLDDTPLYQNVMAMVYGSTEKEMLKKTAILEYDLEAAEPNRFYFYTEDGKRLKPEEFKTYQGDFVDRKIYMHITFQAPAGKMAYLYTDGFYALGEGAGDEMQSVDVAFCGNLISDNYEVMVFDEEVYRAAVDAMKKNQVENIAVRNDTISGTTNYVRDGYTSWSVAYSRDWKAYVDGEEARVECPTEAGIFVKTPAGKHTVELRFVPYGLRTGKIVSLLFFGAAFLGWQMERGKRRSSANMH